MNRRSALGMALATAAVAAGGLAWLVVQPSGEVRSPTPGPFRVATVRAPLTMPPRPASEADVTSWTVAVRREDLPASVRIAALGHLLSFRGRAALPGLLELYATPANAPLRPRITQAFVDETGPRDEVWFERLLEAADRSGEPHAQVLAAEAAVLAARRDTHDPVRLSETLQAQVEERLYRLASGAIEAGVRGDAIEALGRLGTLAAARSLENIANTAASEEDRLEAGLALRRVDPQLGQALLEELGSKLSDPLLGQRWRKALGRE